MYLYLTHTHTHTHTHTTHALSRHTKHSLAPEKKKKQTKATPDHFQPVRALGGNVHLAMQLHQQAAIRDLHMPNPATHIDRLREGICIIPSSYPCGIVDQGIECMVITAAVLPVSLLFMRSHSFLPRPNHSSEVLLWIPERRGSCDQFYS